LHELDHLRETPCTHAGAIIAHPTLKLVSASDFNEERLEFFGKNWHVDSLYTDYKEMLKNERIDILSVAAWTRYHREIVCNASKAGIKGIYCEKPIAGTVEDACEMVKSCLENDVRLLIGHERRYHPNFKRAKELISKGELGKIKTVIGYAQCGKPPQLPRDKYFGGPIFHDGTHLFDIMRFLIGEITMINSAVKREFGDEYVEHTACCVVEFENGAIGFVEGGGEKEYFRFELDIQGTKGRIVVGNDICRLFKTGPSKRFSGYQELEEVPFPEVDRANSFVEAFDDLVNSVRSGREPVSSGIDGLRALEIITALYESSKDKMFNHPINYRKWPKDECSDYSSIKTCPPY